MKLRGSEIQTRAILVTLGLVLITILSLLIIDVHGEFVNEREAKVLLRPKRGFRLRVRVRRFVGRITGERNNEKRENNRESSVRAALVSQCTQGCWSTWTAWSGCSIPCGSTGSQSSTRSQVNLPHCAAINANGCSGPASRTQDCNRKSCANGGTNLASGCNCPPAFTGTCCKNRVTCSSLGVPAHGRASSQARVYNYGASVTYSCEEGYNLVGANASICSTSGRWSNRLPTCSLVTCPDPGTPTNGKRSGNALTYGQLVSYSCVVGYELKGRASSSCQASGKWSHAVPSCQVVSCPAIPPPRGGKVAAASPPIYLSEAIISCHVGFHLTGASKRICRENKAWDGSPTSCLPITCAIPGLLDHGKITYDKEIGDKGVPFSTSAKFHCNEGYRLVGPNGSTCTGSGPQGTWNSKMPKCIAVSCGDPGTPRFGTRSGSSYTFPNSISFRCSPGHILKGSTKLTCKSNGQWTDKSPLCQPCSKNTYKEGDNNFSTCSKCPIYSETAMNSGATSKSNCMCQLGFKGPAGGPCLVRKCTALSAPEFGSIVQCGREFNQTCEFNCSSGYVLSSGDQVRRCSLQEVWSGSQPKCSACPRNTFHNKETNGCDKCPAHSSTPAKASVRSDCTCDSGWKGVTGGNCTDIDECGVKNGGCKQKCDNADGTFRCTCNLPGFLKDSKDSSDCVAENQCTSLKAPDNGGLVCTMEKRTTVKRCQIKCNPGYVPFDSFNVFESCGPENNWKWTTSEVLPCMKQFFPDISQEITAAYLVDDCVGLSQSQLNEAKSTLLAELTSSGMCSACHPDDVTVSCGDVVDDDGFDWDSDDDFGELEKNGGVNNRRRRREAGKRRVLLFRIKIREESVSLVESKCASRCIDSFKEFANETCLKTCSAELTAVRSEELRSRAQNVTLALRENVCGGTVHLSNGSVKLTPMCRLKIGKLSSNCPGMPNLPNSTLCQICPVGTRTKGNACVPCEEGTFQNESGKSVCLKCPSWTPFSTSNRTACLGYSCHGLNPCVKPVPDVGSRKFHFHHQDRRKFIQCDRFGGCFEFACPFGLYFNGELLVCDWLDKPFSDMFWRRSTPNPQHSISTTIKSLGPK